MGERRGTKGLELWCKRMTEGYPGVKIENMTTSWRDGLAFCAIIHHFRPELIDFKKLKKEDVFSNNELAFRVAEQYLGIPALLEAEDMVEYPVPDRLSILTYLSQFYQAFAVTQGSPSRMVPKRPASSAGIVSPASTSPPNKKMPIPGVDILRLKPCAKCSLPVFFAERLNVGKLLYHRTCFRCARCNNQLTLASCYETETPNQYCCETCPDEEPPPSSPDNATGGSMAASAILSRSLSDEEKTAGLKTYMFETALEQQSEVFKPRENSAGIARKSFLQVNMLTADNSPDKSDSNDDEEVKVPELPRTARPSVVVLSTVKSSEHQSDINVDNVHSSNVNNNSDIKVQSDTTEDSSDSSIVKARMRMFEKKCDAQPFTTKVTEIDLSNVTEPKVPVAKVDLTDDVKKNVDTSLIVGDQSDSINLVDKENVQAETTCGSIITVSDETASSSEDQLGETNFKTAYEDSVILISDNNESNMSHEISHEETEESSFDDRLGKTDKYKTTCEISWDNQENASHAISKSEFADRNDNIISISSESNISQEPSFVSQTEDEDSKSIESNTSVPSAKTEITAPKEEIEISNNYTELDSGLQSMQPSVIIDGVGDENIKQISVRESYPGDLNPFGDADEEEEDTSSKKQSSYNPFDEDEDDEPAEPCTPPRTRRLLKLHDEDAVTWTPLSHNVRVSDWYPSPRDSTSEFKKPVPATRKKVPAPKISLTPFWDNDDDATAQSRMSRSSQEHPQPPPRVSDVSSSITSPYGSSSTSLSSITTTSSIQSGKKKAPAPPTPRSSKPDSEHTSLTASPSTSVQQSPKSTPRPRKSKKAPEPPTVASTPSSLTVAHPKWSISPINFDNTKVAKDEVNRNRQSQTFNEPTSPTTIQLPDKSTFGKWKRKKNLAPDKPVAIRRTIKELPMVEVKRELDIIEVQQQGLERQGVKLEHIIRIRCESVYSELNEDNIPIEVEDMILQLFEVVNEKNELCRRQAELMYLKKQHRLEEEHAEVEYQIRCLMLMPDKNKTDTDKSQEEELIKRLIEIVEKKNEIIECLDMDRVREHEEDHSFTSSMNSYANRRDATPATLSNDDSQILSKKEKKKLKKKFKLKLGGSQHPHVDADKDIDETEVHQTKEKKKKKFAIF